MLSRFSVYDWYMPYQCYRCQEFGHSATQCKNNQVCLKCSGNHRSTNCTSSTLKCKNRARKGHCDTNHKTYDSYNCAVYKEEMSKAKHNTDHGFD